MNKFGSEKEMKSCLENWWELMMIIDMQELFIERFKDLIYNVEYKYTHSNWKCEYLKMVDFPEITPSVFNMLEKIPDKLTANISKRIEKILNCNWWVFILVECEWKKYWNTLSRITETIRNNTSNFIVLKKNSNALKLPWNINFFFKKSINRILWWEANSSYLDLQHSNVLKTKDLLKSARYQEIPVIISWINTNSCVALTAYNIEWFWNEVKIPVSLTWNLSIIQNNLFKNNLMTNVLQDFTWSVEKFIDFEWKNPKENFLFDYL